MSEWETEIEFLGDAGKQDDFSDLRNFGVIEEYADTKNETYWDRIGDGGSITANPIVYNDTIYFGACDKIFYAIGLDGNEKWRFKTNGRIQSYATIHESNVYFASTDGHMYVVNAETGELVWKMNLKETISNTPVIHKKRIYIGTGEGKLHVIDISTRNIVWTFKTSDSLSVIPLIVNDKIYIGYEDANMYCLSLDGKLIWKFPANGWIAAWPPAHRNKTVYFGSFDKNMYAVDMNTGRLKWKFKAKEDTLSPIIWENKLYFGCYDGTVYCIDADLGNVLWRTHIRGGVSVPIIKDGVLYAGSYDNCMYAIDAKIGKIKWKFETNGFIHSYPSVYKGNVVFGSWDCNLYCIDTEGNLKWKFPTSVASPSKINPPKKMETKKMKVTLVPKEEKKGEEKYKSDNINGEYEANVVTYADGMSKTYITSKKKGYVST